VSDRLYQSDAYRTEFEAVVSDVVDVGGRPGVVLDGTYFYPESGGQPCDTGTLGGVAVEAVLEDGDAIIHILAGKPGFDPGDRVKGRVDWSRRFTNMQQHTGQHILSQAFERVLEARTTSSALGIEHSTIDVSRLGLTWDDMNHVEALANQMVYENRPVEVYQVAAGEAGELRTRKSTKKNGERDLLRIVEVSDFDRSPCGGTHLKTTGEVGHIKILRWEKVRDTTRVEFVCGLLASGDYFWKNRFVVDLAERLTTGDTSLPALVDGLIEEGKDLRKQVGRLKSALAAYRARELRAEAEEVSGVSVIVATFDDLGLGDLRQVALGAVQPGSTVALFCLKGDKVQFIFSRSEDVDVDMREAMKAACEVVGGRGGGKPEVAQGGGDKVEAAAEAMAEALDTVRARLADRG
jgi:alanyl-tRNA synthetase